MDSDQTPPLATPEAPCPCQTGLPYVQCCQPYHTGALHPATPTALMRSRYAALALGLAAYLVNTTHRDNPQAIKNIKRWVAQWHQTCQHTQCHQLQVLASTQPSENTGTVHFKAHLTQFGQTVWVEEESQFVRLGQRWLYLNGQTQVTPGTPA
jgi:SEC-C motif domain protein